MSSAQLESVASQVRSLTLAEGEAQAVKACCVAVWGIDLLPLLLGASYHPGGLEVTGRLAELMGLTRGEVVLDVASGIGTTALFLASMYHVRVVGVDMGVSQCGRAMRRASSAGLSSRVSVVVGDAERLPVSDDSLDAVVCECALCTFPDKPTAARELARVVRPGAGRCGGRVGREGTSGSRAPEPRRAHSVSG
ncbi:MAG: hypothetical protein KatS3mg008_1357 [Acidimicrobiales bacterium]|nr:MAG: hypothetical protein KatS3mg008_1357 [Acidimicrobiales bacterium]